MIGSFCFAGYCNIITRFGFQIFAVIPVQSYIFNKLESIRITLITFRQIGSHLQRTVHCYVKGQLFRQSSTYNAMLPFQKRNSRVENTRCIIHRAADLTSEWKQSSMKRFIAGKSFIFRSPCRFIADQVGISTAQSCRTYGFVRIHTDFIIGGFRHGI